MADMTPDMAADMTSEIGSDVGHSAEGATDAEDSHKGLTPAEIGLGYDEMASAAQAAHEIPEKSLFRIGEVSRLTATKAFVLRYWETEFPTLEPVKSPSGHRLYRREDIETVFEIKRLLYDEGFTIVGARKHLEEQIKDQASAQRLSSGVEESDAEAFALGAASSAPMASSSLHHSARREPASRAHRKFLLDLHEELLAVLTLLERE
jgi:DNA-binding transcriptional MerR regulator